MFYNIIDLNKYLKLQTHEYMQTREYMGDSFSDQTNIKKSFENNQKINRSMLVNAVTKLVNNVSADVVQKNSSTAASAAGASNTIWLSGVQCDDEED